MDAVWTVFCYFILLLDDIDVCYSDCMGACGNVCCVALLLKIVFISLGVLNYVVYFYKRCHGCCMSVSSCRCSISVCILWQLSMLHSA